MDANTVVGIDLSLTRTALVRLVRCGHAPQFDLIITKPDGGTEHAQLDRMRRIRGSLRVLTASADLIVVEGPSFESRGNATRDLAGLWWLIYDDLASTTIPVAVAAPSVVKKWATGKGNCDKVAVGVAMGRRFPEVPLTSLSKPDEADALTLAGIGAQHAGFLPWRPTQFQIAAHDAVHWPDTAEAA